MKRAHAASPCLFSLALGAGILFASCLSLPGDGLPEAVPGTDDWAALERLEEELVGLQLSPPEEKAGRDELGRRRERVRALDDVLSAMAGRSWKDQGFRLDCMALAGESAHFAGDSVSARRWLEAADELSGYGSAPGTPDPAPILRARLIPDEAKRLEVLSISVDPRLQDPRKGTPGRLLCELAFLRSKLGREAEAREALEAGLAALRPALRGLYEAASRALLD